MKPVKNPMSTAKTQKNELKVYLDHLRDIVRPDCQNIGRVLTHDIYNLFKSVKQPEKETVYVNIPSDDKADKIEIERLKNQLGGVKGNLTRSQETIAKQALQLRITTAAGIVAGLHAADKERMRHLQEHPDEFEKARNDLFASIVATIVATFKEDTTWEVVRTICAHSVKISNELMATMGKGAACPIEMADVMVANLRQYCDDNELLLPPTV
jgi:hypothetical protein